MLGKPKHNSLCLFIVFLGLEDHTFSDRVTIRLFLSEVLICLLLVYDL